MSNTPKERFSMHDPRTQHDGDREYARNVEEYFGQSLGTNLDKLRNFAKFVPRQAISQFLVRQELFKRVVHVHGDILECGVFLGGGLMTWAQLSAINEPYNHTRRIVGFDTFSGFPRLHTKDQGDNLHYAQEGGLAVDAEEDLRRCIELYDSNRPIGHIPRVKLVVGDALETIPAYAEQNPQLVVAMLYLDFDIYEPTKRALEVLLPRMPRGAVLVFDELGQADWPGETLAVLETVGLRNLRIERFPFTSQPSFAVLE